MTPSTSMASIAELDEIDLYLVDTPSQSSPSSKASTAGEVQKKSRNSSTGEHSTAENKRSGAVSRSSVDEHPNSLDSAGNRDASSKDASSPADSQPGRAGCRPRRSHGWRFVPVGDSSTADVPMDDSANQYGYTPSSCCSTDDSLPADGSTLDDARAPSNAASSHDPCTTSVASPGGVDQQGPAVPNTGEDLSKVASELLMAGPCPADGSAKSMFGSTLMEQVMLMRQMHVHQVQQLPAPTVVRIKISGLDPSDLSAANLASFSTALSNR